MGEVVHFEDTRLNRPVAIKFLIDSRNPTFVARFQQEARAVAQLSHPNILNILDFGITEDEKLYMVMELLQGESLDEVLKRKQVFEVDEVLPILNLICQGLGNAHQNGVVHRDIKPSNVMLYNDESGGVNVKIVDFGIAKSLESDLSLTSSGSIIGTPAYISPEAAQGLILDSRSDIYSFGCLVFELLTGKKVFSGKNAMDTIAKHLNEMPPSLNDVSEKEVDPAFESIVAKCLEKDPKNRFQSMDEIQDALREIESIPVSEIFSDDVDTEPKSSLLKSQESHSKFPLTIFFIVLGCTLMVMTFVLARSILRGEREEVVVKAPPPDRSSYDFKYGNIQPTLNKNKIEGVYQWSVLLPVSDPAGLPALVDEALKEKAYNLKINNGMLIGKYTESLAKLKVSRLSLTLCTLDRTALKSVAAIKNLVTLDLEQIDMVSVDYLGELSASQSLKNIFMRRVKFDDTMFDELAKVRNLQWLVIDRSKNITGKGIGKLQKLVQLSVSSSGFRPEYFKELQTLPQLSILHIADLNLTDADIEPIKKLKVQILIISNNPKLSGKALKSLSQMHELKYLAIPNTTSEEVVNYLKKHLPNTVVEKVNALVGDQHNIEAEFLKVPLKKKYSSEQ